MPSVYPLAYPTYSAFGAEMDDAPTHTQVHTQHAEDIQAITAELGLNPSGSQATVAARVSNIETSFASQGPAITAAQSTATTAQAAAAAAQSTANAANSAAATAQATANARAVIASRFVTLAGTSALGNNALNVRAGTIVITLAALGMGGCLFPSVMPGSYVPIVCNGDTGTSNGGASVGVDAWDANGITVHMQRADGTPGSGSVRINYFAIGL